MTFSFLIFHATVESKPNFDLITLFPVFIKIKLPVPKVHLLSPALKHVCPNKADCWSPAIPLMVVWFEGILCVFEIVYLFACFLDIAKIVNVKTKRPATLVVCLSGRGDKDLSTLLARLLPVTP